MSLVSYEAGVSPAHLQNEDLVWLGLQILRTGLGFAPVPPGDIAELLMMPRSEVMAATAGCSVALGSRRLREAHLRAYYEQRTGCAVPDSEWSWVISSALWRMKIRMDVAKSVSRHFKKHS